MRITLEEFTKKKLNSKRIVGIRWKAKPNFFKEIKIHYDEEQHFQYDEDIEAVITFNDGTEKHYGNFDVEKFIMILMQEQVKAEFGIKGGK